MPAYLTAEAPPRDGPQADCPVAGLQGKLTLKTTEMETMYDLGTKLIEALQVSPTRLCKGVSSCVPSHNPQGQGREPNSATLCRSAHPAFLGCTCCASRQSSLGLHSLRGCLLSPPMRNAVALHEGFKFVCNTAL